MASDGGKAGVHGVDLGHDVYQQVVRVDVGAVADLELHRAGRSQHVDGHAPVDRPNVGADAPSRVVDAMDEHGEGSRLVDCVGFDACPAGMSCGGGQLEPVGDLAGVGVAQPHAGRLPDHHHFGSAGPTGGQDVEQAVHPHAADLLVVAQAQVDR